MPGDGNGALLVQIQRSVHNMAEATARSFWRLGIGPQLEPLGKDCPRTWTKVDTRQDDDVFVPSSRRETAAVCGVQSD